MATCPTGATFSANRLIKTSSVRQCLFRGKGSFYAPHCIGRGRDAGSIGRNRLPDVCQSVRLLRPGVRGAGVFVVRIGGAGRFDPRRRVAAVACSGSRPRAADILCARSTPGSGPDAVWRRARLRANRVGNGSGGRFVDDGSRFVECGDRFLPRFASIAAVPGLDRGARRPTYDDRSAWRQFLTGAFDFFGNVGHNRATTWLALLPLREGAS